MEIDVIKELVALMERSSLTHLEIGGDGGAHVVLKREAPAPAAAVPVTVNTVTQSERTTIEAAGADNLVTVSSPVVGVLYRSREPGAEPFAAAGQPVRAGDVLCLVEAMKMFSEIKAPCDGTVREVLFSDGDLAEFNMPLFRIEG